MPTPAWQPSTFYAPGSLVQPATAQPAVPTPIPNWSFESGNVEWTLDSGLSIVNGADHYGPGTWSLQGNTGFTGDRYAEMQDFIDCTPGESITAKCQVQQGASSAGLASGSVYLRFYDAAHILIQENEGNIVNSGSGGAWHTSTVTATAPANTAFVRLATRINRIGENDPLWVDAFEWNKISQAQTGLIFKAVQANVGLSDATEPTWPLVNGQTVVDNTVTWEAALATRIVWQAKPILVSGATEPAFTPTEGSTVGDNTISWRAVSRRVTDPNCPNSKIVIIGASKVFAADDDIVAYSATVNPLDWSTANNAGYIPSNLQQYGANPVAGLGLYRSNLWVGNSQGSQVWQIDEDPQQMALLDAFPVGTDYHDAVSPAFNDLFFLPSLGVRTLGIAGGSTNLQSGDAGMPIDTMVQESLTQAKVNGDNIQALYYPAAGQYWLMFSPPAVPSGPISLSGTLDDGLIGESYVSGPLAVANGFPPYRWEIDSGSLPGGIEMNAFTGQFTGVFSAAGTFSFVVRVTDRYDRTATSPQSIDVAFSTPIVAGNAASIFIWSGASATFPLAQTLPTGTMAKTNYYCDASGEHMGFVSSASPFVRAYKRGGLGTYTETPTPLDVMPSATCTACAISPDGMYLVLCQGSTWRFYKRDSGDSFDQLTTIAGVADVTCAAFSNDGQYVAFASFNGFRVFRRVGDTFTQIYSNATQIKSIAWHGNSRIAACPTAGNMGVHVYSVSGTTVAFITSSAFSMPENAWCKWSNDGNYLYAGGNVPTPRLRSFAWSGTSLSAVSTAALQLSPIISLSIDEPGRLLMVSSSDAADIVIYQISNGLFTLLTPTTPDSNGAQPSTFLPNNDFHST
jgi:hypothetical protein